MLTLFCLGLSFFDSFWLEIMPPSSEFEGFLASLFGFVLAFLGLGSLGLAGIAETKGLGLDLTLLEVSGASG